MGLLIPALTAIGGGSATAGGALAAGVVGTGLSAYGSYASGQAQKASAEYNADMARQQAVTAREDAAESAKRRGQDQKRSIARMRAQYGAQGLAETGAPLDMLGYTAGKFELELADIFNQAQRKATAYENSASLYDFEGKAAGTAGGISAFGSLTRGVSDLGFKLADQKDHTNSDY